MNLFSYPAWQSLAEFARPWRAVASSTRAVLAAWPSLAATSHGRYLDACCELIEMAGLSHVRPPFAIDSVEVNGRTLAVTEQYVKRTPFGSLLHFRKDGAPPQPRVLIVAPMSGHFATLLRGTVRTMLPEHDVYITDWHNARDV
ncbi:MAG TPA: polyhydroxyalkanoate depolymerase, partial [Paraburkholderia sp.]